MSPDEQKGPSNRDDTDTVWAKAQTSTMSVQQGLGVLDSKDTVLAPALTSTSSGQHEEGGSLHDSEGRFNAASAQVHAPSGAPFSGHGPHSNQISRVPPEWEVAVPDTL